MQLNPSVWAFIGLIIGTLVVAGIIIAVIAPLHVPGYENIVLRYKAWWIISLVVGGSLVVHRVLATLLIATLGCWALREYYRMVPDVRRGHLALVGYASVLALMGTAFANWYGLFQVMPIYCVLTALLVAVLYGDATGSTSRVGFICVGIIYFGWMLAHLLFMLNYPYGIEMALYLLLLTSLSDVLAYTTGRLFGRHKLAPAISPNKTVEGLLGGALGTILVAVLLRSWVYLPLIHALALGAIIGIFGVVGDLTISLFKRDRQIKDSGSGIPGHGGLLDRIDSLLFVIPLFFHYARFFGLFGAVGIGQ